MQSYLFINLQPKMNCEQFFFFFSAVSDSQSDRQSSTLTEQILAGLQWNFVIHAPRW